MRYKYRKLKADEYEKWIGVVSKQDILFIVKKAKRDKDIDMKETFKSAVKYGVIKNE